MPTERSSLLDAEAGANAYQTRVSHQCDSSTPLFSSATRSYSTTAGTSTSKVVHSAASSSSHLVRSDSSSHIVRSDSSSPNENAVKHSATVAHGVNLPLPDFVVAFQKDYDTRNPLDWTIKKKWSLTNVLSASGFNRILVSTLMAPALSVIASDLDMSPAESVMALSIYLLASAFGPLFIGPLTEVYGREPVMHLSNLWFLFWNIACGFATTKELLIASRFLAGFGASAIYSLAGAVLSDIWHPDQRGKSLGWYITIPLLAAAAGPIVGGFATTYVSWRWMFWATSIFQALLSLFCYYAFEETFAPVILQRAAARLRKETGDKRYQTLDERFEERQESFSRKVLSALSRPLRLLAFHPAIQVSSIIGGFQYGILYILLATYADLWETQYNTPISISGLHYVTCAAGELVGSQVGGFLMDRLYRYMVSVSEEHRPEYRVPLIAPGAIIAALGLTVYGWAANYLLHWAIVDAGMFVAMLGQQISGMALQAYVMDAYPEHTSSALSALQFLRSMTAFLFPLAAPTMYRSIGYGWGNSTLALGTIIMGFPVPAILWCFRSRLRKSSASHL